MSKEIVEKVGYTYTHFIVPDGFKHEKIQYHAIYKNMRVASVTTRKEGRKTINTITIEYAKGCSFALWGRIYSFPVEGYKHFESYAYRAYINKRGGDDNRISIYQKEEGQNVSN